MKHIIKITAVLAILTITAKNTFCQTKIKSENIYSDLSKVETGPDEEREWESTIAPNTTYEIKTSSVLQNQGTVSYEAKNLNDAKITSVWAEGDAEYGIGTTIEFTFKEETNVLVSQIVNGYYKTEKSFTENSRVKSFKCYLNNNLFAIVGLNDFRGLQNFPLCDATLRLGCSKTFKKGDVLKFEIIDVYKGTKYKDVLITEFRLD